MNNIPPPEAEIRNWAMLTHLSGLAGIIIPFGHIFGPLLVWLLKRNELPQIENHGKEALNFQISITIYAIISGFLVIIGLGLVLLIVVFILYVLFTVIAAIKASNGEFYVYPLTIRFLK
ncbi:MAG: DUF4870 domain-containing protein [Bacteroidales bacterium]